MAAHTATREFKPGTTGWLAADLDLPEVEQLWDLGRYEIVEGVLTLMPPARFDGSAPLYRLVKVVDRHFDDVGIKGDWGGEVDYVAAEDRVGRADMAFMTAEQVARQAASRRGKGRRKDIKYGRLVIAPLLIIESVSPGHERHDRVTKRKWYAQSGVANYWVFDPYAKSLECLRLQGGEYAVDARGGRKDMLRPGAFPGLVIPLGTLWM